MPKSTQVIQTQTNMKETNIQKLTKYFSVQELVDISEDIALLLAHAYDHLEVGCYQDAARLFYIYISENSNSVEAINGLVLTLFELEHFTHANALLDQTLKRFPDDVVTLSNKATLLWQSGHYAEAVTFYEKAITLDPKMIEAKINLIHLYREKGDLLVAFGHCSAILKEYPQSKDIQDLTRTILIDLSLAL